MNMRREFVCLFLSLFCAQSVVALKSYLYYEDAECIDNQHIQGTIAYTYDDATMEDYGFTIENYLGSCRYIPGGSLDLSDAGHSKYTQKGYCIRCNGQTGCTEKKNSCSDFYSLSPSSYRCSGNSTDDYYEEMNVNIVSKVERSIYKQVSADEGPRFIMYCLLGTFLVTFVLFGAFLTIRGKARMNARHNGDDRLSEKLGDDDFLYHPSDTDTSATGTTA